MTRRVWPLRPLTVITAAVLMTALGAAAMTVLDRPGHDHDHHAHLDLHNGLLVSNRTELRMCVESGGDQQAPVSAGLLAALDQVRRHPHWSGAYGKARYSPSTVLDWGCPAPRPPDPHQPQRTDVTATPSPYRVWIYLLDEPTADRMLGVARMVDIATAEFMEDSASMFPVSTALLIRQSRLADAATVTTGLKAALGLDADNTRED